MGALATDYWANSAGQGYGGKTVVPVNNTVYKPSFPSVNIPLASADTAIASAKGAYTPSMVGSALSLVVEAYNSLSKYTNTAGDDYDTVRSKLTELLNQKKQLELQKEAGQVTQQKQDELEDYLKRQQDAVPANAGTNLLSVLTNNGKSLVTSIGTITSTFGEKFDTLNECMYSFLKYMDTVTTFMEKSYDLSKSNLDQAKKEKEATTEVGDTKMTASEIEVQKNLAMMKNYQFKTSPVDQSVLESDSVVGMSPLQIEVSHRSNEVEARVYQRTPTQVKDIDENVLFDIAPREARLVKDATVAKDTTDKINFELDDEDVDLADPLDIKTIFGYSSDSDSLKEFYTRLGGIGL